MTQVYKIQVSMNQSHLVDSGLTFKQGDFGFQIEIEVLDFDVTGVTPQIIFRKSSGAVESTSITVSGNKFTYTMQGTELDTPGPGICDLKLKNSTTQRISTASFKFFVISDTMDGLNEQASSYSDTIAQIIGQYEDDVETINGNIAPAYSTSATYKVEDYVIYNNVLYKCKTEITTAESWTAAHWEQAVTSTDIADVKNAFEYDTVKNILGPYMGSTSTISDITFTVKGQEITVTGTSKTNVDSTFWFGSSSGILNGDDNEYYIDFDSTDINVNLYIFKDGNVDTVINGYNVTKFKALSGHTYAFQIRVKKGGHVISQVLHPVISLTPTIRLIEKYASETKNLIRDSYGNTRTSSGITYTVSNGKITVNGTATATSSHNLYNDSYGLITSKGNYFVGFDSNSPDLLLDIIDVSNNYNLVKSFNSETEDFSLSVPSGHIFYARLRVSKGKAVSATIRPSISENINADCAFDIAHMGLEKTNYDRNSATAISKSAYTNIAFMADQGFSVIDAFTALVNSIDFDSQCALTRTELNTDSSSLMSHDATGCIDENNNKLYAVFVNNDTDETDNPTSTGAFVVLSSADIGSSVDNVTNVTVAKVGDSVGSDTIISGTGVPNMVLDSGVLHILFSAKLSDNKWYLLERDYTISSGTFGNITKCTISVNDNELPFTTDTINEYVNALSNTDTFISVNAQIGSDGTYYYTGLCVGTQIKNSIIISSTDNVNWAVWLKPEWSNDIRAQYEGACTVNNGYIYYALRLNNGQTMLLSKIQISDKSIVNENLIPDCGARACWIDRGDRLYLMHSIDARLRNETLWVDYSSLICKIVFQGLQEYIYPSVVIYDDYFYIISTAGAGQGVVVSPYLPHFTGTLTNKAVANRLARLFNLF